jgi:hypothetical protein
MRRAGLRRRYGHAKGKSAWVAGRAPSSNEIWAAGKPIVIAKEGSAWTVSVMGRPVVKHGNALTFEGRVGAPVGGAPHRFSTKAEAESVAHGIGHYMLKLGDFVFSYVDYI